MTFQEILTELLSGKKISSKSDFIVYFIRTNPKGIDMIYAYDPEEPEDHFTIKGFDLCEFKRTDWYVVT